MTLIMMPTMYNKNEEGNVKVILILISLLRMMSVELKLLKLHN